MKKNNRGKNRNKKMMSKGKNKQNYRNKNMMNFGKKVFNFLFKNLYLNITTINTLLRI